MPSLVRHASAASDDEARPPRRGRRIALVALASVVVIALIGLAAVPAMADDRVPRGTTVAGVSVGRLDRSELRAALRGPVSQAVGRPVHVRVGDGAGAFDVGPATAGITLDRRATEEKLLGDGPMNLRERIRSLREVGRAVAPVIRVDEKDARATLTGLLEPYGRPARNASVEVPAPAPELTAAGDREIRLPGKVTQPKVDSTAVDGVDQLIGTFTTLHRHDRPGHHQHHEVPGGHPDGHDRHQRHRGALRHTGDRTVTSTTGPQTPTPAGGFSVNVQRSIRQGGSVTGQSSLSWTYSGVE